MKKRILSILMCLIIIMPFASFVTKTVAASSLDENEFLNKMNILRNTYRDKEYWNNYNSCGYDGTGGRKCSCNPACSASCSCKCGKFYLNGNYYGGQCYGFANKMGYLTFGSVPTASWSKYTSVKEYFAGDYVRIRNDHHSIFITSVVGNTITYADCNNYGPCQVKWDRTISVSSLRSITTYVYHLKGNNLKGTGKTSPPVPSVDWTEDDRYPRQIKAYPTTTTGKISVYDINLKAYSQSTRYIAYNDNCTINAIYKNGYCEVTYPTANGSHTEFAKTSDFIQNSVTPYNYTASYAINTYIRSNLKEKFGSISTNDKCKVVGKSGDKLQLIYPLNSGGYKLGWIDSSYAPPKPSEDVERPAQIIPDPVASGAFNNKTIVAMASHKISFASNRYISAGDTVKLYNVNPNTGYCTVDYPGGGANDVFSASTVRTETVALNEFISYNGSAQAETAKIPDKLTAYPTSNMQQSVEGHSTNWYLSPNDTYTTINNINGATEVLYYCDTGKHAGCWKLAWVWLDYYYFDLNGLLDNNSTGNLGSYGTADVYINGILRGNDVNDFYKAYPCGSTYEIKDIRAYSAYQYNGLQSGKLSGQLNKNTSTVLNFTKKPVTLSNIVVTSNPSKTQYLEGENLDKSGLVVTGYYSDGTTQNITSLCAFSNYTSSPGVKTVIVTYAGKQTAFTVNVRSKSPTQYIIPEMKLTLRG